MATTAAGHQILAASLARYLDEALDDRPSCTVRVEAPIVAGRPGVVHEADLAVTCREHDSGQRTTPDLVIVIEILSPSTEAYDRRVKVPDYRAIPSIQEIGLIHLAQSYYRLQVQEPTPPRRQDLSPLLQRLSLASAAAQKSVPIGSSSILKGSGRRGRADASIRGGSRPRGCTVSSIDRGVAADGGRCPPYEKGGTSAPQH